MASLNVQKAPKEQVIPQEEGLSLEERNAKIAELAYLKAEQRGFEPGSEWEDWLEAEREVDGGPQPTAH